jgi:hypothetical protein
VIEAPPFQLTLHVTAGHRSAGASRRRSVLEASDLSVEQARFPVLFARNVQHDLVGGEDRRDLRCFLEGGWSHNSADLERITPKVVAVQLDQVEGI